MTWLTIMEYQQNNHGYVPLVVNTSPPFPHSRLISGFVTRFSRRVPLAVQELLTLPEHLSSPPVFSGVRVIQSLVLCITVCIVDHFVCPFVFFFCPLFCLFFFDIWIPITPLVSNLTLNSYHWVTSYSIFFYVSIFTSRWTIEQHYHVYAQLQE